MYAIQIENLKKIYTNGTVALKDVSFSINNGSFFALLGKNGAGKSTAIGILTSLIIKTSGKIHVLGFDLDVDFMNVRSVIGLVSQEYNFNNFESVLDIILNQAGYYGISMGNAYTNAKKILSTFDLWNYRYLTCMKLSGGMKRRLMLARSLIHNPKILVLDEPTAGVDIISRRLIWNFLKELNKENVTIILTTHYLEEVEILCDSVSIIDNGSILLNTSVKDLLKRVNKQVFSLELDITDSFLNLLKLYDFNYNIIDNSLVDVTIDGGKNLNDLLTIIVKNGINIYTIRSKSSRLEDLFIDLIA